MASNKVDVINPLSSSSSSKPIEVEKRSNQKNVCVVVNFIFHYWVQRRISEVSPEEGNTRGDIPVYRYDIVTRGESETPFFVD